MLQENPLNRGVLSCLCREAGASATRSIEWPASRPASSWQSGSHPEIVDHLWESLASLLPVDCRVVVCGKPVLVAPRHSVIFAVPLGTQYGLRLPPREFALAHAAGARVVHHYGTANVTLNLAEQFGPYWIFGTFDPREPDWCMAAYEFAEAA
jgi:hypothetical protein